MREEDLEIIAGCKAAHPDRIGGQHVARSCSGVRVMHMPSGIGVTVTSERSQHGNKAKAIELLRILIERWDLWVDNGE